MKKILITAFDPFGGKPLNASLEVLKHLKYEKNDVKIYTLILPTVYQTVEDIISAKIDLINPDVIINMGEYGGSSQIKIERVALNLDDSRSLDNNGVTTHGNLIKKHGQTAYFSTLPVQKIYEGLLEDNFPVEISNYAGSFLCNHIMYISLNYMYEKKASNTIAGFIHFPFIESQVQGTNTPYLPLETSVKALEKIIDLCL